MKNQISLAVTPETIIFLSIIAIGLIILILMSIRHNLKTANWIINKASRNQNRRREQAARAEAEKAERLATEERRHQEILQAIRESGKMPEDNK